ncbi:tape measure protein [Sporosarcina koreensis]|uniref:tape measure protein n=1 Tax=Sporosarcina koreensis TaxID=334735 RepID=UPI0007553C6B|nr:tape measure protein [Sporosarcina koreensis]
MNLVARLSLKDDFSTRIGRVTTNMRKTESAANRMTSSVKQFSSAVAGISAAIGLTAAVAGGFNMIRDSVKSAMARIDVMESFERVLTVLTGSVQKTKEALDATRESVTGTAYGLDVAAKSVQNFVTRGMDVSKATKTMAAWGDAVAFYGNGSNEQLETVMDALAKMYSSGKVAMDQMNRLYDAGIDGVGMYAKAVGRNVNVVQKELSKGKIKAADFIDVVTKAMMEGTNGVTKIAGAAKEAGASWGASFDNMRAAVTRGVTDIIQGIDKMLVDNGLPHMRQMVGDFGKRFETALKKVAAYIPPFTEHLKRIYNVFKPIMPALKAFGLAVLFAVAALGGFFAVVGAVKAVGAALVFLTSPLGLVLGALTGLGLGFQALYKNSDKFRSFIDKAVGGVKGLFKVISGNTSGGMTDFLAAGFDTAQVRKIFAFADKVKSGIDRIKDVIKAFGSGNVGNIAQALGFSPETAGKITEFIDDVKMRAGEFVTFLMSKWQAIQPGIATLLSAFSTAKETATSIFTTLWATLQPIFSALGTAFSIIAEIAVGVFNNVIAPAVAFIWGAFQTLWKVVGPILELLGQAIAVAFDVLKIVWDNIIKPFASFMGGQFSETLEKVSPVLDKISGAFDWLGEKITKITDWFKGFRDILSNFKVPSWLSRLGGGGTVKFESSEGDGGGGGKGKSNYHGIDYVPYDGYQARLHKGESVVTAQENRERKKGGATGGIVISGNEFHVRQESDIKSIAEELYELINGAAEAGA